MTMIHLKPLFDFLCGTNERSLSSSYIFVNQPPFMHYKEKSMELENVFRLKFLFKQYNKRFRNFADVNRPVSLTK